MNALALVVRRAQRRIAVSRLYGLAWLDPQPELDRINRRICALLLAR